MEIEKLHQLFLKSQGIATDTRKIKTGQIFFALKGENFNGNLFAEKAINQTASYAIVDEEEFATESKFILVNDVLETLQQLANYHRHYLGLPILAITGSNGKTTTKELIHAVLRKKFKAAATVGNFNNHIGVPLTLLSMDKNTEFGIVEMGANHHGEIKKLCEIAEPDYGYITNFGKAHLEGFGSVEGVITAKSELYDYLKKSDKLLFLNADDLVQQKQLSYQKNFSFGREADPNVKVDYDDENLLAQVIYSDRIFTSTLSGTYNAVNIAAAICIGVYFKVPVENIQKAIETYIPTNNRSQIIRTGSVTIVMDAYNANPTSMKAALESFSRIPAGKKTVILGDMFELGNVSELEHQEIVRLIENLDISKAFLAGKNFHSVRISSDKILKYETYQELEEAVKTTDFSNSHILIKGSRGMALERLLEVFKQKEKN